MKIEVKEVLESLINISEKFNTPTIGKTPLYILVVVFVFLLAILQDFIYSEIQETGFYLSETLLYNTLWGFFIPISLLISRFVKVFKTESKAKKLAINLGIGIAFSFLHLLMFTCLFVFVSSFIFTPSHRFSSIFNAALSNQFYIALLWYVCFPAISLLKRKSASSNVGYPEIIKLRVNSKILNVPVSSIQLISTDKPYSIVYIKDQKVLENRSLKEFEKILDRNVFPRVHRSTIINVSSINELKSRKNGDYDAILQNGQSIRLSRHYRSNWQHLLQ